jgi:hypothetical protein
MRTADGREVTVNHPENVAYGGGRIAVVVVQDEIEIIDLLLVPSLKTAAGGTTRPPRGKRTKPAE